jgi:hypothetical protein
MDKTASKPPRPLLAPSCTIDTPTEPADPNNPGQTLPANCVSTIQVSGMCDNAAISVKVSIVNPVTGVSVVADQTVTPLTSLFPPDPNPWNAQFDGVPNTADADHPWKINATADDGGGPGPGATPVRIIVSDGP